MSSFDQLKKEFAGMDSDERTYLGLMGLQNISRQITAPQQKEKNETVNYMDDFKHPEMDAFVDAEVAISEKSLMSLVDHMKEAVFRVKLVDTFRSLIAPLSEELEKKQIEDHLFHLQNHQDATFYRRNMIYAIDSMSDKLGVSMSRGIIMEFRRFSRNPVWGTLRLLTTKVIMPFLSMAGSILTGWKKKSDTDRIVDAINELTTLTRTGNIKQEKTMFARIAKSGVLGTLGRSVTQGFLKDMGIDKNRAQGVEDTGGAARSRKDLTIGDRIAASFFGDEITKKTQGNVNKDRMEASSFYDQNISILNNFSNFSKTYLSLIATELQKSLAFQQSDVINLSKDQHQTLGLIDDSVSSVTRQLHVHTKLLNNLSTNIISQSVGAGVGQSTIQLARTGTDGVGQSTLQSVGVGVGAGAGVGQSTIQLARTGTDAGQSTLQSVGTGAANDEIYTIDTKTTSLQQVLIDEIEKQTAETIKLGKQGILLHATEIDLAKEQAESMESINYSTKQTAKEAKRARRREAMKGMLGIGGKFAGIAGIGGMFAGAGAAGGGMLAGLAGFGRILASIAKRFSVISGVIGTVTGLWKAFRSFEESDDMIIKTLKLVKGGAGGFLEGVADATVGLVAKGVDYLFDTNINDVYKSVVAKTKDFFDDPIGNLLIGLDKLDNAMYKGFDWVVDNTLGATQRMFRLKVEQFKNMVHDVLPASVATRIVGARPESVSAQITPEQAQQRQQIAGNFGGGMEGSQRNRVFDFVNSRDEGVEIQLNSVKDAVESSKLKAGEYAEQEITLLGGILNYIKKVAERKPEQSQQQVFNGVIDDMQLIREVGR